MNDKQDGNDHNNIREYVPRELYAHAIQASLDHEHKGDELEKLGKPELAAKEYDKSLHMEEHWIGKGHPIVKEFQEKLHEPTGSWKRAAHRHGADALKASLQHEKAGDLLCKAGDKETAKKEYNTALAIEEHAVGKNHPMVTSLKKKAIIATE
ncbi:MAG: hypothetical protein SGILL_000818 [Bacillariaceae sp.]